MGDLLLGGGDTWLRRSESKLGTGVFGWYSFPVIQDVQLISATAFTSKFNKARKTVARAFAPAPRFAFAA